MDSSWIGERSDSIHTSFRGKPMSKSKQFLSLPILASCVLCTPIAQSQVLEEVVVTAQKREQSVQDVGITITALSGDDLNQLGFDDPRDLMMQTPGLVVSYSVGSNLPNFALRGVGLNDFAPNNSSPVAVHLDEVYQSFSAFLNFGLFDMERVEILKGPQGTLFGRNTTGGAVNFFSKKPSQEFDAGVTGTYGRYGAARVDFHLNGGLTDTVAGRVSGFYKTQDDGPWYSRFLNRDLGGIDQWWGLRAQLNFTPSDTLDINLNVHGGREDSEGAQYNMLPALNAAGTAPCPAYLDGSLQGGEADCFDLLGNQEIDNDPFTSSLGLPNSQILESVGVNVAVNWDVGDLRLTSITAYGNLERFSAEDADGFPQIIVDDLFQNEIDQFSQELRLSSYGDGSFGWIVGAYYSSDKIDTPKQEFLGTDFPAPGGLNAIYVQESDSIALFASGEWQLSDTFRLTTGLRYTNEERSFDGFTEATITPPVIGGEGVSFDPPVILASLTDEISFDDISWKLGLDYFPDDDWLVYGTVSKGFKSGGFNGNLAFSDAELQPFNEEILIAYEIGTKATLADGRLQWNASIYAYDYQDVILQIGETLPLPGGGSFTVFRFNNGANADVFGAESDIKWLPTDALEIRAGIAYSDTELTNAAVGNENLNGSNLNYTPEWQANWLARYQRAFAADKEAYFQFDGTYKGDQFGEVPNTPVAAIDSYVLLNARVGLMADDSRWDVSLFVQNLADEEYTQYINDLIGLGAVLKTAGYSRTYGISASYNWN